MLLIRYKIVHIYDARDIIVVHIYTHTQLYVLHIQLFKFIFISLT